MALSCRALTFTALVTCVTLGDNPLGMLVEGAGEEKMKKESGDFDLSLLTAHERPSALGKMQNCRTFRGYRVSIWLTRSAASSWMVVELFERMRPAETELRMKVNKYIDESGSPTQIN